MNKLFLSIISCIVILLIAGCVQQPPDISSPDKAENSQTVGTSEHTYKILYVMSFNSPWEWTDKQLEGFKEPLKDIQVEYKSIQLDAKNKPLEEQQKSADEAIALINSWKPDLVYTSDDAAQALVTSNFVNSNIPFLFSGVNKKPEAYGFVGSSNVIGILEHEHYVPTVRLMQEIIPNLTRIAIISDDDDANWGDMYERILDKSKKELPEIEIVEFNKFEKYAEYKDKILEYNQNHAVDAILIIGWFKFKDDSGNIVVADEVAKWTAENSNTPDFTFWKDRIDKGTLASVTVSAFEQGKAAGNIARGILVDGKKPSDFQFEPTVKGQSVISLARANKIGTKIPSDLLLSSEIVEHFQWE